MALARFDLDSPSLSLASIGNIEARLAGAAHPEFRVRRGIVGLNAPTPVVTRHAWQPDSILVLHSDGLHTGWNWGDLPATAWETPADGRAPAVDAFGKDDDDATVLVVKGRGDGT